MDRAEGYKGRRGNGAGRAGRGGEWQEGEGEGILMNWCFMLELVEVVI